MNSVIHYEYAEYNKDSSRYGKCLHKWSRFTKCQNKQLPEKYYCKYHQIIYKRFEKHGTLHPMNDYYPPRADSLYSEFIYKYAPYLLEQNISETQVIEAQLFGFVELFRFNALCKLWLPS